MTTLPQLLAARAEDTPDRVALREKDRGIWREITWRRYLERVRTFALGLTALGVGRGDKVAIIGDNRPEWFIAELAAQAVGGASVGLFQDATAAEVQYIVAHCDARVAVVEDQEQVDKFLDIAPQLPALEYVVYFDPRGLRHYGGSSSPRLVAFEALEAIGGREDPALFDTLVAAGAADDLAVICYTSGTTGKPKGAMLSHRNLLSAVDNLLQVDPVEPGDNYLSFLPCGWIAEQGIGLTCALRSGQVVNFPEEPETVQENLREIGPRVMLAAPRIWETLASTIAVKAEDASWLKRTVFNWGMRIGQACADRAALSVFERLQLCLAERLVFAPLRDLLGLSKLRRAYTGGAALGPDTLRLFRALGVNLKQVYGQTEIGGLSVVHRDGNVDGETVGRPIPNTEVHIAATGEILSRSNGLFLGYYKDPQATAETLADGWLHSGDAGMFDANGELIVLDRVKDLMTLADGQLFAPQYIENKLKFSPYVKETVALGQDRPFVAAIVNIDMANVGKWAEKKGLAYTTYTDLAQKPEVYLLISQAVQRVNAALPSAARINRFVLLHKELDADDDEMTRTRKVRRRVIAQRYAQIIEALYDPDSRVVRVDTDVQYHDGRSARIRADLKLHSIAESGSGIGSGPDGMSLAA